MRDWLTTIGLGQYGDLFEQHRIAEDVLPHLSDQDLKELGIPLGDRRRLLVAIASLAAAPAAPSSVAAAPVRPSTRAERRQLTVLFCDLVGSTQLSADLDPEELRTLMAGYRDSASRSVQLHGGYVAQHLGDGVMAYFGWPRAEEDMAARAVAAALDVLIAVKTVAAAKPLRVRIGIATGPVVVGGMEAEDGDGARLAVGETPNLAARLQAIAGPDEVVVAHGTRRLAAEAFEYTDLGSHAIRGVREPQRCWRVTGRARVQSRFEAMRGASLTPLVGREPQLAVMLEHWQRACRGDGQAILLCGEPGIGKSRLVHALREHVAATPHQVLLTQCSPLHVNTAFYPIVENLTSWAGIGREDGPEQKLDKLDALIEQMHMQVSEVGPLFAAALSIHATGRYPISTLTPQQQRERTVEALAERVLAFTRQSTLLFVLEDVHWADPSTLDTLELIIQLVRDSRALAIVTYRPGFTPSFRDEPHVTTMAIDRLEPRQAAALAVQVAGSTKLPAELLDQIVAKTDGVPLFVEELTKSLLDEGSQQEGEGRPTVLRDRSSLLLPATLRDLLSARLDLLGEAKEVAQIGACIGREFDAALLAAVSALPAETLRVRLERLSAAEVIWREAGSATEIYTFRHALLQEAAYSSLLNSRRQQLHARIAAELEANWPDAVRTQPELMAHHHANAANIDRAIEYLALAGRQAIERSASLEAVRVLQLAIELLNRLPDTTERMERELALQTALAVPLMAVRVYSAPEVGRLYERSYELSRRLGKQSMMYPALAGMASFHVTRSELGRSLELAEEMLSLAQADGDRGACMEAHRLLGMTRQWCGEFSAARRDFARVLELYEPAADQSLAMVYGQDHRMSALCWEAWSLLYLGFPDQAMVVRQAALDAGYATPHLFSRLYAPALTMNVLQFVQDTERIIETAGELIRSAEELGFKAWAAWGHTTAGWARAKGGLTSSGMSQIEHGLALFRGAGVKILQPFHLALAAEVSMALGARVDARGYLDQALDQIEQWGERWFAPEAYRMMGNLMAAEDLPAEAEKWFGKALHEARRQNTKGWELRAALSQAQLMQHQGRSDAAAALLGPVYNWFTEGFATSDLTQARALLATGPAAP